MKYKPILAESPDKSGSLILVILLGLPSSDRHRKAVTGPTIKSKSVKIL